MVQVARRKKGRPSKADLAARRSGESPAAAAADPDIRRSLRRRNVRYNIIEYDGDYVDDEEDERRREKKKLKLMAKLNQGEEEEEENESAPSRTLAELREEHAPPEEEEYDEIEGGGEENEDAELKHEEDEDGVVIDSAKGSVCVCVTEIDSSLV